ncbi:MAG TPA: hypothetical protein VH518_01535 [Tepidisphaeraceae bacterium]|jgi:hypothetical protein
MRGFRRSNPSSREFFGGEHRFEHWYRDNTVYFVTARCRDGFNAFASGRARLIFWDRFDHYTRLHGFEPWVTTLLVNHYHTVGYLAKGTELGAMMRKLHGSVAKLVNDLLPERKVPFWCEDGHNNYFDGCLRDILQLDRAYRYTRDQAVRARIVRAYNDYPDTRVMIDLDAAIRRATELDVFLEQVPYARYAKRRTSRQSSGTGQCH